MKGIEDQVNGVLNHSEIKEIITRSLEEQPDTRWCMILGVKENGSLWWRGQGHLSILELMGLQTMLVDITDSMMPESGDDGEKESE